MLCIWDKVNECIVSDNETNLHIGADGKVYNIFIEYGVGENSWIKREDVSERYEARYKLDFLLK